MTAPILNTKEYLFIKNDVTVYLEIDCRRKMYSLAIKDAGIESIFTASDNFEFNITAAELMLDAAIFAKDELKPDYTVD